MVLHPGDLRNTRILNSLGYCLDAKYIVCPHHYKYEFPTLLEATRTLSSSVCKSPVAMREVCPEHDYYQMGMPKCETIPVVKLMCYEHQCIRHVTLLDTSVNECFAIAPQSFVDAVRSVILQKVDSHAIAFLQRVKYNLVTLVVNAKCADSEMLSRLLVQETFPRLQSLCVYAPVSPTLCLHLKESMPRLSSLYLQNYESVSTLGAIDKINMQVNLSSPDPFGVFAKTRTEEVREVVLSYNCSCVNNLTNMLTPTKVRRKRTLEGRKQLLSTPINDSALKVCVLRISTDCSTECASFKRLLSEVIPRRFFVTSQVRVEAIVFSEGLVDLWNTIGTVASKHVSLYISQLFVEHKILFNLSLINRDLSGRLYVKDWAWNGAVLSVWNFLRAATNVYMLSADEEERDKTLACAVNSSDIKTFDKITEPLEELKYVTSFFIVFNDDTTNVETYMRPGKLVNLTLVNVANDFFAGKRRDDYHFISMIVYHWAPTSSNDVDALFDFIAGARKLVDVILHLDESKTPKEVVDLCLAKVETSIQDGGRVKVSVRHSNPKAIELERRSIECRKEVFDAVRYRLHRDPTYATAYLRCVSNGMQDLVSKYTRYAIAFNEKE